MRNTSLGSILIPMMLPKKRQVMKIACRFFVALIAAQIAGSLCEATATFVERKAT